MEGPTNPLVSAILTDMYQVTMAYAFWKCGKADDQANFDLYFRKNPFAGEFTIFCGLEEALRFLSTYRWTEDNILYLRKQMPKCEEGFFEYLAKLDCSKVKVYALKEGSLVFPSVPLLRVEGGLIICQLLETTLLTLVNYASLVATNAARYRLAAESGGKKSELLEFGLRRAQGPDGGISASRYAYVGGFDATSNVMAGFLYDIDIRGTHAHSFITAFRGVEDLPKTPITHAKTGEKHNLADLVFKKREQLKMASNSVMSELVAFIVYAHAFPDKFMALIDTYNTLKSGVPNFLCVALALHDLGYSPIGIRLDSGDLAYLSKKSRALFVEVAKQFDIPQFESMKICASSDIDEETLYHLNRKGHEIDIFGIGTNLVTCKGHPALGCIYKLTSINGTPRIKLSNTVEKVTIPARKQAYRLMGQEGPVVDLLVEVDSEPPKKGERVLCHHPFDATKRCWVVPTDVQPLHSLMWDGKIVEGAVPSLADVRKHCLQEMSTLREDHKYRTNPTPYKVSLSPGLYKLFHDLWEKEAPIEEIR